MHESEFYRVERKVAWLSLAKLMMTPEAFEPAADELLAERDAAEKDVRDERR